MTKLFYGPITDKKKKKNEKRLSSLTHPVEYEKKLILFVYYTRW